MMEDVGMVAVHRVFERHLPVATVRMLKHTKAHDNFAFRRKIDELIQQSLGRSEAIFQRKTVGTQAGEDQPAIGTDARNLGQRELILAKRSAIAGSVGNTDEVAAA